MANIMRFLDTIPQDITSSVFTAVLFDETELLFLFYFIFLYIYSARFVRFLSRNIETKV